MATCCHCVSPCWAWQKHWTHCPMRWCTWYCGARKPAGSSFFLKGCLLKTEVQLEIRMPNGKLGSPEISSKAMSAGSGQKHWAQWARVPVTEEGVQMRNSTTALSCQGLVSSWNPELSSAPFVLSELAGGWHIAAWSLAGSCCPMLPGHQDWWYQEEWLTPALWHDLICSRKWPQVTLLCTVHHSDQRPGWASAIISVHQECHNGWAAEDRLVHRPPSYVLFQVGWHRLKHCSGGRPVHISTGPAFPWVAAINLLQWSGGGVVELTLDLFKLGARGCVLSWTPQTKLNFFHLCEEWVPLMQKQYQPKSHLAK